MIDKKVLRELVQRKFVDHEATQVDTEVMALSEQLADELTMPELEVLLDAMTMPLFKYILSRNDAQQAYDSEFATDMMARIFQEVRKAGASNASAIYYLFLGYLECMKSVGEFESQTKPPTQLS